MIIIADSSALIALAGCDALFLLEMLFSEIKIPEKVFEEITVQNKPEAEKLKEFLKNRVINLDRDDFILKGVNIGDGELRAITLYQKLKADFLLIDDKLARKIALINKINIIGSLGIIIMAKEKGFIAEAKPYFEKMHNSGIRISQELLKAALKFANEF